MYIRLSLLFLFSLLFSSTTWAQESALVKGKLVGSVSKTPVTDAQIIIPQLSLLATSDANGNFTFSQVAFGSYMMIISNYNAEKDTISLVVNSAVVEIGEIPVKHNDAGTSLQSINMPIIAMEETDFDSEEDGVSGQNVSGLLTASRDPFLNTVAFTFGPYFFQPRGYDRNQQDIQINGVTMNDIETGEASWGQWGGLNDVFRGTNNTYGLQPSDFAFGGINGNVFFDAVAAKQRKQTRVTYSLSNRNYNHRLMVTQNSGLNEKGWAYSFSASKRWAKEAYVPGTFYDGYSYYAAVSKVMKKQAFHFTTFGAPTRRGKSYPQIQELNDLAGTNFYNRNWGYQNGEKRNARVSDVFQPVFILNHEYKPNDKFHWNTALGYQFGKSKNSNLDWFNALNPWPDYYGYLPSYYLYSRQPNPTLADETRQMYKDNPDMLQVNWDRMYNVNYMNQETVYNANGIEGNNVTGKRSLYVLSNFVENVKKATFNTYGSYLPNEHARFYAGLNIIQQNTESYKELADLLGGDFYVDLNQFAQRTYAGNTTLNQNNVDVPNRVIKTGDKYGYDYITRYNKSWVWGQGIFTYNKVDFFISGNIGMNSFSREGLYRSGLFPDSSLGKSATNLFLTYGAKGGVTYKINGRNYLFVNAGYTTQAPTIDNTYISPRQRNSIVSNPEVQKNQTLEAGYYLKSPKLNGRLVGYVTDSKDGIEIQRFYNDAPEYETFVNYAMRKINTRFTGIEFALEGKISSSLSATAVAAVGQSFFTNNPLVSIYRDNDTATLATDRKVYINNYYLGVGPQSAYSLAFDYRSKKYWYATLSFNYMDRNYLSPAADRRSEQAVDLVTPGSERWKDILDQEKAPSFYTVNLFFGKSFMMSKIIKQLPRSTFLYVNVSVNNLLNNKQIITGGFEQLRYSYDASVGADRFPSKYFYGYGRNYSVNVSLKF